MVEFLKTPKYHVLMIFLCALDAYFKPFGNWVYLDLVFIGFHLHPLMALIPAMQPPQLRR